MKNYWAEITGLEHEHGGPGWELGSCLWSPTTNAGGNRVGEELREPASGEVVYHLVRGVDASRPKQRFLYGRSWIKSPCRKLKTAPPNAGQWAGRDAYYRIDLEGFQLLPTPISLSGIEDAISSLILEELDRAPKYFPYMKYRTDPRGFRGRQGAYLAKLTPSLASVFEEFAFAAWDPRLSTADRENRIVRTFTEGEEQIREIRYLRRNPGLRDAAIAEYGFTCAACKISLSDVYGDVAKDIIDVHHLKPISLRKGPGEISLDDVRPLCPNCHRVAHKRWPEPYSVEEIKAFLKR